MVIHATKSLAPLAQGEVEFGCLLDELSLRKSRPHDLDWRFTLENKPIRESPRATRVAL